MTSWALPVTLILDEYHRTPWMLTQHYSGKYLTAPSHYLCPSWPTSMSLYGVNRRQPNEKASSLRLWMIYTHITYKHAQLYVEHYYHWCKQITCHWKKHFGIIWMPVWQSNPIAIICNQQCVMKIISLYSSLKKYEFCILIFKLTDIVGGPFYWYGLTLIPVWISNYNRYKVWGEINYPVMGLISNFNPHCTMYVITDACWV